MAEINIAGSIKELIIFDDSEYCNNDNDYCRMLGENGDGHCHLWREWLCSDMIGEKYIKHIQCKEAYDKYDCMYSEDRRTKENCGYWETRRIK